MAIVLDGIVFGLQLSMLAVGLTLVYGLGGVLNLAHGQLVASAAVTGSVVVGAGLSPPVAITLAVLVPGILGLLLDRTLMRPVYRLAGEPRVLLSLLLTLGVAFALDGALIHFQPQARLSLSLPGPSVEVLGVTMRSGSVAASVITVAVLGVLIGLLRHTRWGRVIRAVAQDERGAQLCGVNPAAVRSRVFVLSGLLAGLVAVTQGLVASVGAASGADLTILALIVTVVGGLGRVSGALSAGVLLGIVHALATHHIGAFFTVVVLLATAMLVILVRPSGILGRAG
ncbi:MAG: branched-chain amino acid ABC transporter permease [Actinomycetota bacterium]